MCTCLQRLSSILSRLNVPISSRRELTIHFASHALKCAFSNCSCCPCRTVKVGCAINVSRTPFASFPPLASFPCANHVSGTHKSPTALQPLNLLFHLALSREGGLQASSAVFPFQPGYSKEPRLQQAGAFSRKVDFSPLPRSEVRWPMLTGCQSHPKIGITTEA